MSEEKQVESKNRSQSATTQPFTQKYAIVQFFEPIDEGYEYSSDNWPLHSTIVDTFAIDWSVDEMVNKLAELLCDHAPAESVAEGDKFFGESGQVQVTLLDQSESLVNLHFDVVTALEDGGLVLNDPQFARNGFLPHATAQKHARLHKGDEVAFTALSIVDMFPDADAYKRRVLKTIKIEDTQHVSEYTPAVSR